MQTQTQIQKTFIEQLADYFAPRLRDRRNELERAANTDDLTGLANRRAFKLAEETAQREGKMFILLDANNFGRINKQCSHKRGDEVLQQFARQIETVAQNYKARAFRLGGDEFAVICSQFFAAKIRDRIEFSIRPIDFGNFVVSITGEIGFTVAEADTKLQSRKSAHKRGQAWTF